MRTWRWSSWGAESAGCRISDGGGGDDGRRLADRRGVVDQPLLEVVER